MPANGSGPRWWVDGSGRFVKQFVGLSGEDTRYRFFVQSVSAAGLESGWVEGPRIQMGHVEQGYVALRKAFDATLSDPDFVAEAKKANMDIGPMDGATVQRLVEDVQSASDGLRAKVRGLMPPR